MRTTDELREGWDIPTSAAFGGQLSAFSGELGLADR